MAFAPGFFCGLLSGGVSLGRNFAEFQKIRDEGVLAKFPIARLYWHYGSRGLHQNVVLCLHLRRILIRRRWHSRQGVFCGLLFAGVSLGRNFAEFQKTRPEGLLGKLDITRLHGHFGSRVWSKILCWGGLLFAGVSPGRNFAEFQKTRAEGLLGKFDIGRLHGHFGSPDLQQNECARMTL